LGAPDGIPCRFVNLAIAIIALVATVAAAVAALGSWRSSILSNKTALQLADIERDRRHAELIPKFDITASVFGNTGDDAYLNVRLVDGPLKLDSVVITILDETGQDHWARGLPKNLTAEQAETFVWGPWEFNANASAQVANFRATKPKSYDRVSGDDWDKLHVMRTRAGSWMSEGSVASWRADRAGPMRLVITCELAGFEPWSVPIDLTVEDFPVH
jgi:hypothetical protein